MPSSALQVKHGRSILIFTVKYRECLAYRIVKSFQSIPHGEILEKQICIFCFNLVGRAFQLDFQSRRHKSIKECGRRQYYVVGKLITDCSQIKVSQNATHSYLQVLLINICQGTKYLLPARHHSIPFQTIGVQYNLAIYSP